MPPASPGRSFGTEIFVLILLRTALKDRPKGPSTANRQPPPTANRRQPPTNRSGDQPPTGNHQPPIPNHQLPPTTINRHQPPVANRQPPTTNRQPLTANTWCARGPFWETWVQEHFFFFFFVKDCPELAPGFPFTPSTGTTTAASCTLL